MALLRNIGGIGIALADVQAIDTDTVYTGIDSGSPLLTPRVPIGIDTMPEIPASNVEQVTAPVVLAKEINWGVIIGLGSIFYTLVTKRGIIIKNPVVTVGGGLALLVYSLRKK